MGVRWTGVGVMEVFGGDAGMGAGWRMGCD